MSKYIKTSFTMSM